MSKNLIILLGIILLAILGYFCIYKHSPTIQSDIDTRANIALTDQGLSHIAVDTDGRDIVLTGTVASETIKFQAEEYVKNIHGVRTVVNQLNIAATPEPEPEPEIITKQESVVEEVKEVILTPKLEDLPEYTCQQDFDTLLSANKINFATNSADIDTSSIHLLNSLIDIANQCPEARIEIGGHTDSRGSDEYNQRLSQSRALSVMNYLIKHGIESTRLSAVGYGESNPIADNDSAEGLTKNRRIEFNVEGLLE